ncbi:MAG: response regulator [Candidatus Aminicenantes bacterium]|nr:MAG: response regulator [Candidatus Aminicenantes bacterium]
MSKKILLVEHNPETIDIVKEVLYHEIFDITVAGNAETAKKLLAAQTFHLVITEALLPKSHGFILSKYISENYPGTKIIIISEKLKNMDYQREALEHGACEYIEKPLKPSKFRKQVSKHLDINQKEDKGYHTETTKINVIPLLDKQKSREEKKSSQEDDSKDENKKDTARYEIKLD